MRCSTSGSAAAAATLIISLVSIVPVMATEFCVSCDGPTARYTCAYDGAAVDPNDARLKLLCITELAKAGKHTSCSVDRQQQATCSGEIKRLALPDGFDLNVGAAPADATLSQPPSPPAVTATPQTQQEGTRAADDTPAETAIPKTAAPPKTMKEAVEKGAASTSKALEDGGDAAVDAAKATGSTLEKAGKAVGDAAKKSWNCITSLFGDC